MERKVAWDIEERKLVQVVPIEKKEKQAKRIRELENELYALKQKLQSYEEAT